MKSFKIILVLVCLTSFSGLSQSSGGDDINNEEVRTPFRTPRRARPAVEDDDLCNAPRKRHVRRVAAPLAVNGRDGRGERVNEEFEIVAALPLLPGEFGTPEFDAIHAHDQEQTPRQPRDLTPNFNEPVILPTEEELAAERAADLELIANSLLANAMRAMGARLQNGCGWEIGELGFFRF